MMGLDVAVPHSALGTRHSALSARALAWGRDDARNLCLLLAGFALVLLLVPPMRAYPMSDDWAYAQSVERLLHLTYKPHDWTQPIALGHVVWGALFTLIFGSSFTALTAATLVLSALCLLVFYTLLRHLRVAPTPALLGTALLGLNPLYVYLSYTFMTDITFMLYVLCACLCFVRWAQGKGDLYLILGSAGIALAYLTRQHGIVLLLAMLFYLWWSRRLTWRSVAMLCAVPLVLIGTYMVWERTQPIPLVSAFVAATTQQVLGNPLTFVWAQMQRSVLVLALPGLCLLPLVAHFKPRKPLAALPIFLFFVLFQVRSLSTYGTVFPPFGSLIDHGGLVMYDYDKAPIWTEHLWTLLGLFGAAIISLYLAAILSEAWTWATRRASNKHNWRLRPSSIVHRPSSLPDPAIIIYATGLLLALLTFASPYLFDRYVLPLLPMMLLFPLRRMSVEEKNYELRITNYDQSKQNPHSAFRIPHSALLLLPIALFSLLAMRDYRAHSEARWEAANSLVAQGATYAQVSAGFEWLSWHLFEDGVTLIRASGDLTQVGQPYQMVLDPKYTVGEWPQPGYNQIAAFPYDCWLCGGSTRLVLVHERVSR
jgi:hypothetical protein